MSSSSDSQEYRRRICRAIDFVTANLASNPTVTEIAKAAPFSQYHFQRLFRALVGESVAEFTRRLRLETAARRLLHGSGGDDITGLAMDLGFSSSQNFAKAFRKHFDVSPSKYVQHFQSTGGTVDDAVSTSDAFSFAAAEPLLGNAIVRNMPPQTVAYRRHFGSYEDAEVQLGFEQLQTWAQARDLHHDDRYLGIPWDDAQVTPEDRCRFDACLIVDEGQWLGTGVNTQVIPAGKYATYRSEITDHDFDLPWSQLMQSWLPSSGYEPADGPRLELYHSDGSHDPAGRWDVEVCLPVRPL